MTPIEPLMLKTGANFMIKVAQCMENTIYTPNAFMLEVKNYLKLNGGKIRCIHHF